MNINWYPGHMAKARRLLAKSLQAVDVVIELLDARIPASSRNPLIEEMAGRRPVLVVLNKSDLADPALTAKWVEFFRAAGREAVSVDSTTGRGTEEVLEGVKRLYAPLAARQAALGRRPRPPRCMVVGIPNVGKSLFINRLAGRKAARAEDRPGVTRGRQWVVLREGLELLDTPGILWPKIDTEEAAFRLAVTGAIKEDVFDVVALAGQFLAWLVERCPKTLAERYALEPAPGAAAHAGELLAVLGEKRGFMARGGKVDLVKAARHLLKEFREGKLGRLTLEEPPVKLNGAGEGLRPAGGER